MPYCPRCGVETEPSVRSCPLCSTPVPRFDDLPEGEPAWPRPGDPGDPGRTYLSPLEIRGKALGAVTGVLVVSALIVAAVDLLLNHRLTWSVWPLGALTALWGLTATALWWHRRPSRWLGAWYLIVVALLALFDAADGPRVGWFFGLGLPLVTTVFGVAAGTTLVVLASRGAYQALGTIAVGLAFGLSLVDLSVTSWLVGQPAVAWSLVTDLVFVPLASLLYFVHYGLGRRPDLGRIFHF